MFQSLVMKKMAVVVKWRDWLNLLRLLHRTYHCLLSKDSNRAGCGTAKDKDSHGANGFCEYAAIVK